MGDARAGVRSARGAKRGTIRRRAVGTRDRIISHLAAGGDITDPTGMASTRLAEAVGYPGSSVAFAQLLSGMERDGLIRREVRGKRTYHITLPEGVAAARAAKAAGQASPGAAGMSSTELASAAAAAGVTALPVATPAPGGGFDYDELARRLLVQVVRKLASASIADTDVAAVDAAGAVDERVANTREKMAAMEETVAGLERELATAWTRHGTLTAENSRLREQLTQMQRDLAVERSRRAPLSGELNQAEVVVLERLLDAHGDNAHEPDPSTTGS